MDKQPDFLPAWVGLGEVYLGQERWEELDQAVGRLRDTLPV